MLMSLRAFAELLKLAAFEWWQDNTLRLAASLAFYTIFSLAPVLIIAIAIARLFVPEQRATEHVLRQVGGFIGPQGGQAIGEFTVNLHQLTGGPSAVALGIATLLIGSTAVFAELQASLNHIWDVRVDGQQHGLRKLLRRRLSSFVIVLAVGVLLLATLAISATLAGARAYLDEHYTDTGWLWYSAHLGVDFVVVTVLFAVIYRYLPDAEITWRDVSVGALTTAGLFMAGKFLIGYYLGQAAVSSVYAAAGSIPLLLLWVYYSALICFYGAEFTQVYARRYGSRIRPKSHAVRVGGKTDEV